MGCATSISSPAEDDSSAMDPHGEHNLEFSHYQMCALVDSWNKIKSEPDIFGKILCERLFESHPELLVAFNNFEGSAECPYSSTRLSGHPQLVMRTIDSVISSIHDVDAYSRVLENIGWKHADKELSRRNLEAFEEALMFTLKRRLGTSYFSEHQRIAWTHLYLVLCKLMQRGLRNTKKYPTSSQ